MTQEIRRHSRIRRNESEELERNLGVNRCQGRNGHEGEERPVSLGVNNRRNGESFEPQSEEA